MHSSEIIILTLVNIVVITTLTVFSETISWGFTTISDCLELSFDPVCYSESDNKQVEAEDPMWWPHRD